MCAGGQRKRRAAPRQRLQAAVAGVEEEEDVEAEFNPENPYQVSHTNKLTRSSFICCVTSRYRVRSCLLRSEGYLRRLLQREVSHSCANGSRCRGQGGGAQIVTANLSVCGGVFSVHALSIWGCPKLSIQYWGCMNNSTTSPLLSCGLFALLSTHRLPYIHTPLSDTHPHPFCWALFLIPLSSLSKAPPPNTTVHSWQPQKGVNSAH